MHIHLIAITNGFIAVFIEVRSKIVHKKFHGQDAHGQCSTNAGVHTLGRFRTILFLNLCNLEVVISCIPHPDAQTLFKGDEIHNFAFTYHSSRHLQCINCF